MTIYPLLQILFFISVFFAPKDATEITLTGPNHTAHWTLTASGWSEEKKVWSLKGNSTVVHENGRADEVTDVAGFVQAALGHDWAKEKKVMLSPTTSLEQTDGGFIYRLNVGGTREQVYRITYRKKG